MTDFAPHSPAMLGNTWSKTPPCNGGGGGGDAAKEAKKSRLLAKKQHEDNMRLAREQMRQAANVRSAEYAPPSAPQSTNVDTVEAGRDLKRRQKMRFGAAATQMASAQAAKPALGSMATLG